MVQTTVAMWEKMHGGLNRQDIFFPHIIYYFGM